PILLGCLGAAAAGGPLRLLFVDGHEDAWPPAQSSTGEAADMELGWLLGLTSSGLRADLRREIPVLIPSDVIVLGPRDQRELADAGVRSIADLVQIIRPDEIASDPMNVTREAARTLGQRGPWWLHVDLDVLATDSLAAVDYRQAGGLDWPTLTTLTRAALAAPGVLGWDVTIYNPDLDQDGADAARIVRYMADALG
ncbi:MAG: arginase family protein, partial [Candidatus Limnocylindria bacterium]